jgi:hypothetical protein
MHAGRNLLAGTSYVGDNPAVFSSVLPAAVAAGSACGAAILLALGLRGQRVDDHPICRRCGFDLFGRTARELACRECGADLTRWRALRAGSRARNPTALLAAAVLLVVAATASEAYAWVRADGEWIRYSRLDWVVRDAQSTNGPVRDKALAELVRRIRAGQLPPDRQHEVVELALHRQADLDLPWAPLWGDVIESARLVGQASEEQWRRYQVQSITLELAPLPQRTRSPNEMKFQLARGPDRIASNPSFRFALGIHGDPMIEIGGTRVVHTPHRQSAMYELLKERLFPVPPGTTPMALVDVPRHDVSPTGGLLAAIGVGADAYNVALDFLPQGPQKARLKLVVRPLRLNSKNWRKPSFYEFEAGERNVELEAQWTLLPREVDSGG